MKLDATTKVPVERLRLDRRNPRLMGVSEQEGDESIIARLYRAADLDELLQSISANGYLDIEPLVVTGGADGGEIVVLEGNRRLAAIRLLREPALVARIVSSEKLRITVPQIDATKRSTIDAVSVYAVADRAQARSFIGFKHINGPAKWDAYAKAKFAADWYKAGKSDGVGLNDVARAIGDRHDTVKRMVSAIYVLDQAADNGLFDVEQRFTRKFNFSHLYTALGRSPYMEYLDLGAKWARYDPSPDPVPSDRLAALQRVLVWIYGSKKDGTPPVVQAQNPDVKRLGEVLANAEARHVLEETSDLDAAHASTKSVDTRLTAALIGARAAIQEAAGSLRAYDGQDRSLLDIAEDVLETAQSVHLSMAKKFREAGAAQ